MLIDTSYFRGDLEIAQLSFAPVAANVTRFINQYEPKYLQAMLGYAIYKDFIAGLLADPIDSKWTDLLNGAEYINQYGVLDKWPGLLQLIDGGASVVNGVEPYSVKVGGAGLYDPATGTSTVTIPPEFVGKHLTFMQRGIGPLRNDEYTVNGNVLTLLGGLTFAVNDTYFYFGNGNFVVDSGSGDKQSPIANYVYYWYLRQNATTTAGGGEALNNVSLPVSPADKQRRAWNEMVNWNQKLTEFLYSNNAAYGYDESLWYWNRSYNFWWYRTLAQAEQHSLLTPITIF